MNSSDKLHIHELILKAMDNTISPEEFAELNRLLATSPESQRYYGEVIEEYRSLYECTEILSSLSPSTEPVLQEGLWQSLAENERNADAVIPNPSGPLLETPQLEAVEAIRPRINRFSLYTAIISVAALVMVLAYVRFIPQKQPKFCGYISRTMDAVWVTQAEGMMEGAAIYNGPVVLKKGLVELVMESGARVILQGPIQLNIESPSQLFMDEGHIAVSYERKGGDTFVVRTPNSCVVDFGTEFGVSVNSDGLTETHVRQGTVELRAGSNPSNFTQSLKLLASQAGRSETDGSLKEIQYEKTKFVYKNEFETRIRAQEGPGYYRWLAYSYQLRRDPDLVLYYPFFKSDQSQSFVTNAAAATENTLNGTFGGSFGISRFTAPTWTEGRWPQKAALRFERDKRNCVAVPDSPVLNLSDNLTLAVWVRCPDAQKGGHIISRRQGENVNYQFGCFCSEDPYYANRMQLLKYNKSPASTVYSSNLVEWTSDWTLLTVTYDTKFVRFYMNGQLFESVPFEFTGQTISAPLIIGDISSFGGRTFGYAAFNGLMDEIAIFKRVLSADEIKAMYEAGESN